METTPEQVLKKYWGYDYFRPSQAEIIQAILQRKDVIALLPTGGGKSVCFQVPALLLDGSCLVVTPLIALMEDQVNQLKHRGIAASAIHSGMSKSEIDIILDNCAYGKVKFLYLSPERIQTELFQVRIEKINVNLIAIDEAHCISQWGYDFRPSYLQLKVLRELKPEVPMVALTATATIEVCKDIAEQLEFRNSLQFQNSFARPNISLVAREAENKEKLLLQILQKVRGSSIVYVRSRKATEKLAQWLNTKALLATFYHAGLTHQQRMVNQQNWISGEVRVIVATNAFGMGIDKADVRTVIHMDIPETLEAYYQEAGRAGRDGKKSYAVIIFHPLDIKNLRDKVTQGQPGVQELQTTYQALANYFQLAEGSAMGESFNFDMIDFVKRYQLTPISTYVSLKKLEEQGLIQLNEGFYRPSRLHFWVDKKRLYEFQVANAHFDPLIKGILRLYGAEVFSSFVNISESQISRLVKWTVQETKIALVQLQKMQFLQYEEASDTPQITYLTPRQDANHMSLDIKRLKERRDLALFKMESMIKYATQNHQCRTQYIQSYFGEHTFGSCGVCDVCLEKRKKENQVEVKDYHDQVLALLHQKPMTSDELELAVNPDDHELFIEVIREMLDDNEIKYDEYWVLRAMNN